MILLRRNPKGVRYLGGPWEGRTAATLRPHAGALARALVACWLAAAVPANALAGDTPVANAGADDAEHGAALFNPLTGAAAPVTQAVDQHPDRPQGDWTLPVLVAAAGLFGVGVLMRRMID